MDGDLLERLCAQARQGQSEAERPEGATAQRYGDEATRGAPADQHSTLQQEEQRARAMEVLDRRITGQEGARTDSPCCHC